jgi:hypothetical protein
MALVALAVMTGREQLPWGCRAVLLRVAVLTLAAFGVVVIEGFAATAFDLQFAATYRQ